MKLTGLIARMVEISRVYRVGAGKLKEGDLWERLGDRWRSNIEHILTNVKESCGLDSSGSG
jgi:hypothetical protein